MRLGGRWQIIILAAARDHRRFCRGNTERDPVLSVLTKREVFPIASLREEEKRY